jgi:hypothetical protein
MPAECRLAFAYVEIRSPGYLPVEDEGCAEFLVRLEANSSAKGVGAVGPIRDARVRIVSVDHFLSDHNGHLSEKEESKGKETGTRGYPTPTIGDFLVGPKMANLIDKVEVSRVRVTRGLSVFLCDYELIRTRLSLLQAFFTRVARIKGLKKKIWHHQISSVFVAIHDSFAVPLAYQVILKYGIEERRLDLCFSISLFIFALTWLKYYIKLNYFHGSMLVQQHIRALLVRKYLSLSERDRNECKLGDQIEQAFSVAFQTTT